LGRKEEQLKRGGALRRCVSDEIPGKWRIDEMQGMTEQGSSVPPPRAKGKRKPGKENGEHDHKKITELGQRFTGVDLQVFNRPKPV